MTHLSVRDRLRMTWELTWPMVMLDAAVVLLIHGLLEAAGETWDSVWAVASFFVVSPWVVRRALRLRYGRQRIVVVNSAVRERLSYQESLKIMWLLAWRTVVLSLAALLIVSGALKVGGHAPREFSTEDPMVNSLGLTAVDAISSLLFSPFLIPGMLRKRYRGFHLEIRSAESRGP